MAKIRPNDGWLCRENGKLILRPLSNKKNDMANPNSPYRWEETQLFFDILRIEGVYSRSTSGNVYFTVRLMTQPEKTFSMAATDFFAAFNQFNTKSGAMKGFWKIVRIRNGHEYGLRVASKEDLEALREEAENPETIDKMLHMAV